MPKVIENIEEKILEAAESLFSKYGYNDVDMRAISNKAGVAVGTVYNYFPDKKALFIEAFKKSWETTFLRLDEIIRSNDGTSEKLALFVDAVYEGIALRKGTGIQLLIDSLHSISANLTEKSNNEYSNGLEIIGKKLQDKTRILIDQISQFQSIQLEKYVVDKLADALILLVWGSVSNPREDRIKSTNFICDMIQSYVAEQASCKKNSKSDNLFGCLNGK